MSILSLIKKAPEGCPRAARGLTRKGGTAEYSLQIELSDFTIKRYFINKVL